MTATVSHHRAGTRSRRQRRRPRQNEAGVILVLMALTMAAVLIVATLIIDGSQAYAQRRSMQNAADEAALAATRTLDRVRSSDETWSNVVVEADKVASANGADTSTCTIIDGTGADLGSCTSEAIVNLAAAAGVSVRANNTRASTFGNVADRTSVTASADAKATTQPFIGKTGSPFVICGKQTNPSDATSYKILNPDNSVNVGWAMALGTFALEDAQVPKCGAGAAFKGKLLQGQPVPSDSWWAADNGNGFDASILKQVLGATPCPPTGNFTNCDMVLPIADRGDGNANNITMHVVAWAVFHVTGDGRGNPKYSAKFVSISSFFSNGLTSNATATSSQARIIRLIA